MLKVSQSEIARALYTKYERKIATQMLELKEASELFKESGIVELLSHYAHVNKCSKRTKASDLSPDKQRTQQFELFSFQNLEVLAAWQSLQGFKPNLKTAILKPSSFLAVPITLLLRVCRT